MLVSELGDESCRDRHPRANRVRGFILWHALARALRLMALSRTLARPEPLTALTAMYNAAIEAAAPGPALRVALDRTPPDSLDRVWLIAIGKAANEMAASGVEWLAERGSAPVGGIIIAPRAIVPPHASLQVAVGNHPVPGVKSFAAGSRLGDVVAKIRRDDDVWVLLSGGASSLTAVAESAVRPEELTELTELLLRSGFDIGAMNIVRKRFTRWGAGRLAVALEPARVRCLMVSDVIGDDLAAIGSGPCVPDPSTALEVRLLLTDAGLWDAVPFGMRHYLQAVERDPGLETPKPGGSAFWNVEKRIIASNRQAIDAAAARASALGYTPNVLTISLSGEAATVGRRISGSAAQCAEALKTGERRGADCLIWGGETTVKLSGPHGIGGRSQELALAAARELRGTSVTLLAAGTDGRDGPTDAAGAIVDGSTWELIMRSGRDPDADLARHNAYEALAAAGALLRTGPTGSNVMDVVFAHCG